MKLLGVKVVLSFMQIRLSRLWQPKQAMEVNALENDYFLVCFAYLNNVFYGGALLIADHYMVVLRWHLEFFPMENDLIRAIIWVRIPLPANGLL